MSRDPFAGCLCATGSNPICPADRHLPPDPAGARRDRARVQERVEAERIQRRLIRYVGLALALALAIPGSAFAVNATGTTPETVTVAATISATFPASITYGPLTAGKYDGTGNVSNLQTNSPTGMSVDMTVSDFTGPATVSAASSRSRDLITKPGGWSTGVPVNGAARALGFYATTGTVDRLASTASATAGAGSFAFTMHAENLVVPGTYSGTLSFTAYTNP